jgi:hypothetical protein
LEFLMAHTPSAYLTAALRSRLIKAAVTEENTADISFFLEELGLNTQPDLSVVEMRNYLQSQLAQWARQADTSQNMIRCCEGLAQFYLWEAQERPEILETINKHLPEGLNFSLISGRILLEEKLFFAPENKFSQEKPYLEQLSPPKELPSKEKLTPLIETNDLVPEVISTSDQRQVERQRIVSQRMHMLKNQLSERTGS